MTEPGTSVFRADHVGSFLRPGYLIEAREQHAGGAMRSITDGEFRRSYFHIDFLEQLGGVKTDIPVTIQKPDGSLELAPPVMRVVGKVRHIKDIQLADFEYLKSQAGAASRPKVNGTYFVSQS